MIASAEGALLRTLILPTIAVIASLGQPSRAVGQQTHATPTTHDQDEKALIVVDASKVDNSIDPALVTYTSSGPNMYGQPMRVVIPARFATEAGLIATARRLAKDNRKYPLVIAPVQIYSDAAPTREIAEYWHNKRVHDIRLNNVDGVPQKIIFFQPHDYRPRD